MKNNVVKFGGSSVASLENINCCKNIIFSKKTRKIIVVSAFGKQNENDEKLTNLLIDCVQAKLKKNNFEVEYKKVEQKIKTMCKMLGVDYCYNRVLKKIKKQFITNNDIDFFVSRGEYLTGKILAKYFCLPFVDAKNIMFFKNKKPDYIAIKNMLNKIFLKHKKIIIPGFYAVENSKIFLFSRGGSDISGAILANAINAKIYENFTDVNGFLPINPNIVKNNIAIKKLDIKKLEFFTKCDATVLHQDCAKILKNSNTILKIKSTLLNGKGGTKITKKTTKNNFICKMSKGKGVNVYINYKSQIHKNYYIKYANCNNIKYADMSKYQIVLLCDVFCYKKVMQDCFCIMQHLSWKTFAFVVLYLQWGKYERKSSCCT